MVHYQRYPVQMKKVEDCEAMVCPSSGYCCYYKTRARPKLLYLLFISLLSCCLIVLVPNIFGSSSSFSLLYSYGGEYKQSLVDAKATLCSSVSNGTICCDRTSRRTDVCVMKGDVRTHSVSSSIFLYTSINSTGKTKHVSSAMESNEAVIQQEKIKPYTRKWEKGTMDRVGELDLVMKQRDELSNNHGCDVKHNVPAVFFSTSGYTGNLYHEFNDGILPLYITSRQFKKKVVFVIQEYHEWWIMKYGDILSQLSDYPAIDFNGDKRTHCFPKAIVGLRIHDELTVDPLLMQENRTIVDFRKLLDRAYAPRIKDLIKDEQREALQPQTRNTPKLVILSRNGSRAITNEDLLVKMAKEIGYSVEIVRPDPTTELARIYQSLNSSDVMIGVHGAAMTHLLFMRPGSVFIQVVPLGTEWAAENYYGEPARKLGLKYIGYQIRPEESSLYDEYDKDDPVLRDPDSVNQKGWEYTKSIYLDRQSVRLSLGRFQKWLLRAYRYSIWKRNHPSHLFRMH